jgi:nucleotide-binding universal stress UspA family protein
MYTRGILALKDASAEVTVPVERLRIRSILCPVDFSDFSHRAVCYAASLARHFDSRLFIQHIAVPGPYPFMAGFDYVGIPDVGMQLQSAREGILRMLRAVGIATSEVTVLLNEGDVTASILGTARKEGIDLLVMGTHGHKGFNRLFLGSVAEAVIHQATCPVLVVSRPQEGSVPVDHGEVSFNTILLATDFSRHSDRALAHALRWGCEWCSRVVLFHAVEASAPTLKGMVDLFPEYNPYFERQVAGAWDHLRDLVPETAREWCQVDYDVRRGNPKDEILRVAEEKGANLVITGARGAGNSGASWGSVSSAVVRDGRFPTLVVRELPPQP